MNLKRTLLLLFLNAIFALSILGQARKYSNEFLSIGVDAKAFGMSNAMVSHTKDVSSAFWNPAGLVHVEEDRQIALMHAEYFAGIAKYDYGALAANLNEQSCLAFSLIRFGVDDIPNTTELIDNEGNINYDKITTFSAVDYGFYISYARKHPKIDNLSFGSSIKIIHRKAGDFAKSWGFGIDIGAQYKLNKWNFGLQGKDITSTFNAWSFNLSDRMKEVWTMTGNKIPVNSTEVTLPKLIFGVSREIDIVKKLHFMPAMDLDVTFDGKRNVLIKSDPVSIEPHLGVQFDYGKFAFLRAGIGNIQEESNDVGKKKTTFQPNMGVGIVIKKQISIDYALTDLGNSSIALYSNIFSLKINLNRKNK